MKQNDWTRWRRPKQWKYFGFVAFVCQGNILFENYEFQVESQSTMFRKIGIVYFRCSSFRFPANVRLSGRWTWTWQLNNWVNNTKNWEKGFKVSAVFTRMSERCVVYGRWEARRKRKKTFLRHVPCNVFQRFHCTAGTCNNWLKRSCELGERNVICTWEQWNILRCSWLKSASRLRTFVGS